MKVAIIGNMNNNGFSIMRYFRDLGVDAHLFYFSNDSSWPMEHFSPEKDTWEFEKWKQYIHKLNIENCYLAITGNPIKFILPPSKKNIKRIFSNYSIIVGSGIAPALFERIGLSLDIYYPYAIGVESVNDPEFLMQIRRSNFLRKFVLNYVRQKQIDGIKKAQHCLNSEMSLTKQTFREIGKDFIPLDIPMVYTGERNLAVSKLPSRILSLADKINKCDYKVFSHARLLWKREQQFSADEWDKTNKHSDWIIIGFSEFVKCHPEIRPLLVLTEYGADIVASKQLCKKLKIEKFVLWIPLMSRREIMYLLSICDIGIGEFMITPGVKWGGVGWEVLSSGKPLIQSFNFTEDNFFKIFGHKPPPILDAKSSSEITSHLVEMYINKDKRIQIGRRSREWFNEFNGIGLAEKWLALLSHEDELNF
ncbi:hypothetical protein HN615_07320 [Candidatus Woesearchaeota archaeon]|jgi:hypothetical protein|nr:hypothetical protein [Candidatus Woesearchaeota archaeon]